MSKTALLLFVLILSSSLVAAEDMAKQTPRQPVVVVRIRQAGVGSDYVRKDIVAATAKAIGAIPDIRMASSHSIRRRQHQFTVTFPAGADWKKCLKTVRQKVDTVEREFPEYFKKSTVEVVDHPPAITATLAGELLTEADRKAIQEYRSLDKRLDAARTEANRRGNNKWKQRRRDTAEQQVISDKYHKKEISHKEFLDQLIALRKKRPTSSRQARWDDLIGALQADRAPAALDIPESQRTDQQKIAVLIYQLRDQASPASHGKAFPPILSWDPQNPTIADQIVAYGKAAAPQLIEALRDRTPTRTLHPLGSFGPREHVRRQDIANMCLGQILGFQPYSYWATGEGVYSCPVIAFEQALNRARLWQAIGADTPQLQQLQYQITYITYLGDRAASSTSAGLAEMDRRIRALELGAQEQPWGVGAFEPTFKGALPGHLTVKSSARTWKEFLKKVKPTFIQRDPMLFPNICHPRPLLFWIDQDAAGKTTFRIARADIWQPVREKTRWVLFDVDMDKYKRPSVTESRYSNQYLPVKLSVPTPKSKSHHKGFESFAQKISTGPGGEELYQVFWAENDYLYPRPGGRGRHLFLWKDAKGKWQWIGHALDEYRSRSGQSGYSCRDFTVTTQWKGSSAKPVLQITKRMSQTDSNKWHVTQLPDDKIYFGSWTVYRPGTLAPSLTPDQTPRVKWGPDSYMITENTPRGKDTLERLAAMYLYHAARDETVADTMDEDGQAIPEHSATRKQQTQAKLQKTIALFRKLNPTLSDPAKIPANKPLPVNMKIAVSRNTARN